MEGGIYGGKKVIFENVIVSLKVKTPGIVVKMSGDSFHD